MSTKRKSIVKSLIDLDAEVNSRDREGESPLHKTCISGDYELLKMLLSTRKSEINLQNCKGQTPLHLACRSGVANVIILLLEEKADIHKEDEEGKSPLQVLLDMLRFIETRKIDFKYLNNVDEMKCLSTAYERFGRIAILLLDSIVYDTKHKS
ncbi:unnamed protein product [Mytilus edulis]|uniref:Uncharacterized protein n=1 Tax=Mytilus edulis TaxID=6550 RepID=A0A8S3UGY1_MYTED|nr:unnamed protein product [Mytilus edulis]